MAIGEMIRKRREDLGMTQEDLCKQIFKTRAALSMIERGHRNVKGCDVLRFCKALRTDPNTLFNFKNERES